MKKHFKDNLLLLNTAIISLGVAIFLGIKFLINMIWLNNDSLWPLLIGIIFYILGKKLANLYTKKAKGNQNRKLLLGHLLILFAIIITISILFNIIL